MEIRIVMRTVYGHKMYYPNCQRSSKIAELLKKKTLSRDNLGLLTDIGFTIIWDDYVRPTQEK